MAWSRSQPYRGLQKVASVVHIQTIEREANMSRETITRQRQDDDTQAFLGHMTNQAIDEPEQQPDDRGRRQLGPERSPNQKDAQRLKNNKRSRDNRK
jgi:hypothetical protein